MSKDPLQQNSNANDSPAIELVTLANVVDTRKEAEDAITAMYQQGQSNNNNDNSNSDSDEENAALLSAYPKEDKKKVQFRNTVQQIEPLEIDNGSDDDIEAGYSYTRGHPSRSSSSDASSKCTMFLGCGVFVGLVVGIAYLGSTISSNSNNNDNDNNPDTCNDKKPDYTFTTNVPYQFGGELCIQANKKLEISALSFQTNGNITDIWGDLSPWDSTFTTQLDGVVNTYTIIMNWQNLKQITAGSEACLRYNTYYSSIYNPGPFGEIARPANNVWMNSKRVPRQDIDNCAKPAMEQSVIGYYTQWSRNEARNFTADKIPFNDLTQVNYAFIGFNQTTGDILTSDRYADGYSLSTLFVEREKNPNFKVQFAVGGYCSGPEFKALMENDAAVERFTTQAAQYAQVWSAGWDIDMENWGEDRCKVEINPDKLVSFSSKLREKVGSNVLLTMAGPGDPSVIKKTSADVWQQQMQSYDALYAMTYDEAGSWQPYSDYRSPLNTDTRSPNYQFYGNTSVVGAIETYESMGIPSSKLGIGVPAYGGAIQVTELGDTNGVWQPNTFVVPVGQYDGNGQHTGSYDYKCIVKRQCNNGNQLPADMQLISTSENPYGDVAKQPVGVSSSTLTVVFYDDTEAAKAKAMEVKKRGHAGVIIWDLSGDVINSDDSLTRTVYQTLAANVTTNSTVNDTASYAMNGEVVSWNTADVMQGLYEIVKQHLPADMLAEFVKVAASGGALSFITTVTADSFKTELAERGLEEKEVAECTSKINAVTTLLVTRNWIAPFIKEGSYQAGKLLNCSETTANMMGTGAVVAVNLVSAVQDPGSFVVMTGIGAMAAAAGQYLARTEWVQENIVNAPSVKATVQTMTKMGMFAVSTMRSFASQVKEQVNTFQKNMAEESSEVVFGGTGPSCS